MQDGANIFALTFAQALISVSTDYGRQRHREISTGCYLPSTRARCNLFADRGRVAQQWMVLIRLWKRTTCRVGALRRLFPTRDDERDLARRAAASFGVARGRRLVQTYLAPVEISDKLGASYGRRHASFAGIDPDVVTTRTTRACSKTCSSSPGPKATPGRDGRVQYLSLQQKGETP